MASPLEDGEYSPSALRKLSVDMNMDGTDMLVDMWMAGLLRLFVCVFFQGWGQNQGLAHARQMSYH